MRVPGAYFGRGLLPRIDLELLEAERDALALAVELQDDDVQLVADLELLGRVVDAAPRHVRDVQQAVDAARSMNAPYSVRFFTVRGGSSPPRGSVSVFLLLLGVLSRGSPCARGRCCRALVDLDDAHAELLSAQRVQVPHGADVHERAGRNAGTPMSTLRPPLMRSMTRPEDRLARLEGALDLVPHLHLSAFSSRARRSRRCSRCARGALRCGRRPSRQLAVVSLHLVDVDDALGLESDVDDDFLLRILRTRP
jgi:hypothetical protein